MKHADSRTGVSLERNVLPDQNRFAKSPKTAKCSSISTQRPETVGIFKFNRKKLDISNEG